MGEQRKTVRFACETCGCDFVDMAEPRVQTSWNGGGVSGIYYNHTHASSCIRALKDRVAALEKALADRCLEGASHADH